MQWVVSLGKSTSSTFIDDSAAEHLLFFGIISIIDEPSVIIIVLSWFHSGVLNEPSEVFGLILACVLRKKSFSWLDVMSDWMLLSDSLGSCVSVRVSKKVFANQALNVTSVARNLLIPDLMVRTTNPISGESTFVAMNFFILVNGWNES